MEILVTGGAGYIGSHTCVELINAGFDPVIIDNLCNSKEMVIDRIETITGKRPAFYKADVRDKAALTEIFDKHSIEAVIHFAGLKAVGESCEKPLEYYDVNIGSTVALCEVCALKGVKKIVFSSSATVYKESAIMPLKEDFPKGQSNPYGRTKYFIENILTDISTADPEWTVALLRYFNPIGAHKSGLIGEDPKGIPNNLMPYISQVAVGKRSELHVFGNDYPTPDGTGVRDYIHVVDLAKGHVKAIEWALSHKGCEAVNLGTGKGTSVLELKSAFEKVSGKQIPFVVDPRRAGDIAECYADPEKAEKMLGWKANLTVEDMCADSWRWQHMNPDGYKD